MDTPRFLLAAALAVLAGCGPGRAYREPPVATQPAWVGTVGGQAGEVPLAEWWRSFADPRLDALVAQAVARNLDLQLALSRVDEARARRRVVKGQLLPDVDLAGSAERRRDSGSVANVPGGISERYEIGFDASWEIDIWGGLRRAVQAANADLAALEAARVDVLTTVVAETARAYLDLLGAQELLAVARADLEDQRRARDVVARRVAAGVSPEFELAQAEAQLASSASLLPDLEARRTNATSRLAVLLAQPAGELLAPAAGLAAELPRVSMLPEPRAMFAAGLPSDLVRRRSDLRRAEREVAAAVGRVGVAERDLYPRFSLTGSFGLESDRTDNLTESGSRFWSVGPAVRWPLLGRGRIHGAIAAAETRVRQAELVYQQGVLVAFAEVEDGLAALARAQERARAVAEALVAHERALRLARIRYEAGVEDLLALLTEQRAVSQARLQVVDARHATALRVVALAKALGGGWDPLAAAGSPPPVAAAPAPAP